MPWDSTEWKDTCKSHHPPTLFNADPKKHVLSRCGPSHGDCLGLPFVATPHDGALGWPLLPAAATVKPCKSRDYHMVWSVPHRKAYFLGHSWFCETWVHFTCFLFITLGANLVGHVSFPEHSFLYSPVLSLPGSAAHSAPTSKSFLVKLRNSDFLT